MLFRDGKRKTVQFPAIFALLEHPTQGQILFDTGYSERFFTETRRFPASLYRRLTPVYLRPEETAVRQLAVRGIAATDVRMVIISHFHADHVCGLADFPNARYCYFEDAYTTVCQRRGLRALRAAFLPGLIPPDFVERSQPITISQFQPLPPAYTPFDRGVDLFGDGALIAVCVPGHAAGQMGLFVQTDGGEHYFLVADACWHSRASCPRCFIVIFGRVAWPPAFATVTICWPGKIARCSVSCATCCPVHLSINVILLGAPLLIGKVGQ
jgi:glyoxylase-like metal-dependent hydrolase (beta-lactamase superfamily II)